MSTSLYIFVVAVGNSVLGFVEKLTSMENSGVDKYGSEAFLVNSMAVVTIIFANLYDLFNLLPFNFKSLLP